MRAEMIYCAPSLIDRLSLHLPIPYRADAERGSARQLSPRHAHLPPCARTFRYGIIHPFARRGAETDVSRGSPYLMPRSKTLSATPSPRHVAAQMVLAPSRDPYSRLRRFDSPRRHQVRFGQKTPCGRVSYLFRPCPLQHGHPRGRRTGAWERGFDSSPKRP